MTSQRTCLFSGFHGCSAPQCSHAGSLRSISVCNTSHPTPGCREPRGPTPIDFCVRYRTFKSAGHACRYVYSFGATIGMRLPVMHAGMHTHHILMSLADVNMCRTLGVGGLDFFHMEEGVWFWSFSFARVRRASSRPCESRPCQRIRGLYSCSLEQYDTRPSVL